MATVRLPIVRKGGMWKIRHYGWRGRIGSHNEGADSIRHDSTRQLLQNQKDGTFKDIDRIRAALSPKKAQAGMGVRSATNRDGNLE